MHTGNDAISVSIQSLIGTPAESMVQSILDESVASMLALTPLPMPSHMTAVRYPSLTAHSTRSPHSSSPFLLSDE